MPSKVIDLGKKENMGQPISATSSKNKTYYPSLYINKDLGFDEKDVGKIQEGIIKYKIKAVEKRISEGKTRDNTDLEILSLSIKKPSHYKKD